jgi:quercetin dioxygenase-like cupin family protein
MIIINMYNFSNVLVGKYHRARINSMVIEHRVTSVDGPFSESALCAKLLAMGYTVRRYVIPPGTLFPERSHNVDKIDAVVAGRFRIQMGDGSVILLTGDTLQVPRGAVHSAEVIGDQAVISLDAVKA